MDNIVEFKPGRPRIRNGGDASRQDAQILFFTGVRYVRDRAIEEPSFVRAGNLRHGAEANGTASGTPVERATH